MRKFYNALALCGLVLSVSAVNAQTQKPIRLSLNQCIDYALKNSYTMKNAHLNTLVQQETVKQTAALAMPKVTAKADLVNFNVPQFSFFDVSTFDRTQPAGTIGGLQFTIPYTASASATASQILFDGSVLVALQARNAIMELARKNENLTAEEIRYGITKAYNSLVIARKQQDILGSSLSLARNMQEDLIKTKDAGFAEKIDVDRSSVQINNLAADSMKLANMLEVAEQALKYQMGLDLSTKIYLTDTAIEESSTKALALVAAPQNYDKVALYGVLKSSLELTKYDLKRHKLAALPTVAGFWSGGLNYGAATFGKIWEVDKYKGYSSLGLSISANIFGGFERQHKVRQAKLSIEIAENNIKNLERTLDFQSESARNNLKNALLQVQSQKRNLDLSNTVLELAQKKYKAGVGSNLEVTSAQTDLLLAQNNYFAALLDAINAEADLKKSLGLLN